MGLRDRIAAIKAERSGPTQSSAIGVQQAIEAENAARAAQNAAAAQTLASVAAQSVFGPVNPPEGSHAVVGDVEPLAENFTASGQAQPLPPAENAARAATLRGSTNQVTYGPVNPPEGAFGPAVTLPKTLEQSNLLPPADAQPLPPAEAPTRPDAPQATRRRGRPPGSKNKVKGLNEPLPEGAVPAHEILTYVSAEECAAAEEARVSDTIPAPSQELLSDDAAPSQELLSDDVMAEIAKRVTSRIARALLATINENEEP